MRCPTCKKPFPENAQRFRPFCSERCKMIDLGRWLDGSYAIPGEPVSDEDLEADLQTGSDDGEKKPPQR